MARRSRIYRVNLSGLLLEAQFAVVFHGNFEFGVRSKRLPSKVPLKDILKCESKLVNL